MQFEFGVAGVGDDPAIRRLLARNPMPGAVTVAFEREPDFFAGHGVLGERCVTLTAVDRATGELAGILSAASAERFINGSPTPVGYIGEIRIDERYRGYLLPMRSAAFVRSRLRDGWPDLWFSAIVAGNPSPRAIFAERARPSFPALKEVAQIQTLGLFIRDRDRTRSPGGASATERPGGTTGTHGPDGTTAARGPGDVTAATAAWCETDVGLLSGAETGLDAVVDFLGRAGQRREFFPCYRVHHFTGGSRTPGLAPGDFVVARRGNNVIGVCAVWDQSDFKQTVVHGYDRHLRVLRPIINFTAPVTGLKRLPAVGERIRSAVLLGVLVENDNPNVFALMLRRALAVAARKGADYLLAGFASDDPLLAVARRRRHIPYRSWMYAFRFDGTDPYECFDRAKVPYLEIGAL